MNQFQDVFISYGRADSKDFAKKLNDRLIAQGLEVWFDFDDIPLGVDYQNQIDDGIEKADNFLFIIAPHSVNSPYCGKEVELALKRHKRIIPILHVEQISRETWQTRNPNGTDEQWQAYTAQGKHSSFPNMHPEIGKINWVYLRENIDDFDQGFQGLLDILERQKIYVHQHTQLLAKALEWERNRKQSQSLLTGEERQQAEEWLKIRFKEEQAPCTPSDLHCEYITESIKNANNLMTQVFISYADEDRDIMQKIRNSLQRESITVWTNKTDIQTGESFEEAIKRGIEQADNIVFLLSSDSLKSAYCQQELKLAGTLNKRIIPLLVQAIDLEQIPEQLRSLQYIDLTDNVQEDDYLLDESQLLKIIHEDAAYYNEHKILLTKALKWQQQNKNPSILLRGYNLRSAEAWMKVAKTRTQHPPTVLQEEFVAESLNQPPLESLDVFISYSRSDSDFARKLNDTLQMQGKTTWFDQESIASGSDFQQEIYRGIKACDNFLFVLSPRSIHSPYCADEVEYAASLNKRFVTLLHQPIATDGLHPELAKVQWIDFSRSQQDFNAHFNQLVRTLDTDREHVQSHTKWLQRALEWEQKAKSADLLLRGSELAIAQTWLEETEQKKKRPAATDLQKEYISDSQKATDAEIKREKQQKVILKAMLGLMSTAFIAAVGVSVFAFRAKQDAERNLAAQVTALGRYSKTLTSNSQEFDALIEGIRGGKSLLKQRQFQLFLWQKALSQPEKDIEASLMKALFRVKELNRIEGQTLVRISPNLQSVATLTPEGTVRLWNFQGQEQKLLSHDGEKINTVTYTQKGDKIFTVSSDQKQQKIKLWDSQGQLLQTFEPIEEFDNFYLLPNEKMIVTYRWTEQERLIKIWKIEGQKLIPLLKDEPLSNVTFSNDLQKIITSSPEGDKQRIKIWDQQEKLLQSFDPVENFDDFYLSPNEQIIITNSWDNNWQEKPPIIRIWAIDNQNLRPLLANKIINDVEFSRDSQKIYTMTQVGNQRNIQVWNNQGKSIAAFSIFEKSHYFYLTPNENFIITEKWENNKTSYKVWKIENKNKLNLFIDEEFNDINFSQDGKLIAAHNGQDNVIQIWSENKELLRRLNPTTSVDNVYFGSDPNTIATISFDQSLSFWNINRSSQQVLEGRNARLINGGRSIASFEGKSGQYQSLKVWNFQDQQPKTFSFGQPFDDVYNFSGDGKLVAIPSSQGSQDSVKIWNLEGQEPKLLLNQESFIASNFSEDSQKIITITDQENKSVIKIWDYRGKFLQSFEANQDVVDVFFVLGDQLISTVRQEADQEIASLWKIENQKLVPFLTNERFNKIESSPNGKLLVTYNGIAENRTAKIWHWRNGQIQPFLGQKELNQVIVNDDKKLLIDLSEESFNKVVFSQNGKLLVTFTKGVNNQTPNQSTPNNSSLNRSGFNQQRVQLWTSEGEKLYIFPDGDRIDDVMFSPDGSFIVTFDEQNKIITVLKPIGGQIKPIISNVRVDDFNDFKNKVSFRFDNRFIATVNRKHVIQIWNSEGQEINNYPLNTAVESIGFSPDGKSLAILPSKEAPILWFLDLEKYAFLKLETLIQKACERVDPYLKSKNTEDTSLCEDLIPQKSGR